MHAGVACTDCEQLSSPPPGMTSRPPAAAPNPRTPRQQRWAWKKPPKKPLTAKAGDDGDAGDEESVGLAKCRQIKQHSDSLDTSHNGQSSGRQKGHGTNDAESRGPHLSATSGGSLHRNQKTPRQTQNLRRTVSVDGVDAHHDKAKQQRQKRLDQLDRRIEGTEAKIRKTLASMHFDRQSPSLDFPLPGPGGRRHSGWIWSALVASMVDLPDSSDEDDEAPWPWLNAVGGANTGKDMKRLVGVKVEWVKGAHLAFASTSDDSSEDENDEQEESVKAVAKSAGELGTATAITDFTTPISTVTSTGSASLEVGDVQAQLSPVFDLLSIEESKPVLSDIALRSTSETTLEQLQALLTAEQAATAQKDTALANARLEIKTLTRRLGLAEAKLGQLLREKNLSAAQEVMISAMKKVPRHKGDNV